MVYKEVEESLHSFMPKLASAFNFDPKKMNFLNAYYFADTITAE